MLPNGDTTSYAAAAWAHNQAAFIGGNDLFLLIVLTHHAFHEADNPEGAPVGQVMYAYSSIPVLMDWTGLSESAVYRSLTALQTDFGYIRRFPRRRVGRPGRQPRVIRVYWTQEHDVMRAAARAGGSLPEAFTTTAWDLEKQARIPRLRVVKDEVEQVATNLSE